jgi:hypothetical protein
LREVDFSVHGTFVDAIFTQPVFVLKILVSFGVGRDGICRFGGSNIETIRRPTSTPTNNQGNDIISYLFAEE